VRLVRRACWRKWILLFRLRNLAVDALFLRRKNLTEAGAKIMSGLLPAMVGETMEANEKSGRLDLFEAPRSALNLRDVPLQRLGNLLLRHCSHDLLDDLSVLEQQQGGDSLHAIAAR